MNVSLIFFLQTSHALEPCQKLAVCALDKCITPSNGVFPPPDQVRRGGGRGGGEKPGRGRSARTARRGAVVPLKRERGNSVSGRDQDRSEREGGTLFKNHFMVSASRERPQRMCAVYEKFNP